MTQNFNPLEKLVARALSRSPRLKTAIKNVYSRFMFMLKRKSHTYLAIGEPHQIGSKGVETFFGYYDHFPDNGDGLVLVHKTVQSTKLKPKDVDGIQLNVYSLDQQEFILSEGIEVNAFNWQQGCRPHWLDSEHFVFNHYEERSDTYQAQIYSLTQRKVVSVLDRAVQDSYQHDFMLSISYERLAQLRPDYGYFKHQPRESLNTDSMGIWKLDYHSKSSSLLFSLQQVIDFESNSSSPELNHKLNHVMISPDGSKFIFMHRSIASNGQRFDRLLLSDVQGNLLSVLADNQMVSHCFWFNEYTVLGYLRGESGEDAYWLIDVNTGQYSRFVIDALSQYGDGHPSVFGEFAITDTYPDKSRMQSLLLIHIPTNNVLKLGEFYHGFNYTGESRCDLHPRFSSKGDRVFFDSVFSGKRQLCCLDIDDAKRELMNEL
jgi:hypothetical protein